MATLLSTVPDDASAGVGEGTALADHGRDTIPAFFLVRSFACLASRSCRRRNALAAERPSTAAAECGRC